MPPNGGSPVTRPSPRGLNRDIAPLVEIRVARRYRAAAERVFDAWLDPGLASRWLFATASHPAARVEINARAGGAFRFVEWGPGEEIEYAGEFIEIARPRRLAFTLSERLRLVDCATRVRVAIVPAGPGCKLTLVHERVRPHEACRVEGRWDGMLYGLGTLLEGQRGLRKLTYQACPS